MKPVGRYKHRKQFLIYRVVIIRKGFQTMEKRVFTLVELLIVIGIIIILSGILLPTLIGAGKKADQAKARAEIATLLNAIKQFESTYGVLPLPMTYPGSPDEYDIAPDADIQHNRNDTYTDLILILQGEDPVHNSFGPSNANPNTRRIRFLDVVRNTPGEYRDPWDHDYHVVFDRDYDGQISPPTSAPSPWRRIIPAGYNTSTNNVIYFSPPFYFSVIIWSDGSNARENSVSAIKDNVYSFPVQWSSASRRYEVSR